MKIAAITDDGQTISHHFGRAIHFMVVTVEAGKIIDHQLRDKLGHSHFVAQLHEAGCSEQAHGMDGASASRLMQMSEAIIDCEALLCQGMGMGAYQSMQARGIRPIITDISDIDEAVMAYARGEIVDHEEKLH
jgi:predicted Fe-Mo cluster-binding NifX family protein